MPSINEVIERVSRLRESAVSDEAMAAWLIELDGKLSGGALKFPEDGDSQLTAGPPYDNIYELYLLARAAFAERDYGGCNAAAQLFNEAFADYRRFRNKKRTPQSGVAFKGVLW
ncbi:hypothetical protein FACS18949_09360 [Clostridia bacterium]|nr:hypothetical protein FACS189425_10170 [Clostridia bacterium]GHV34042.1 hypothetical protein FACS18949_09360 [Clostridia bacterium]